MTTTINNEHKKLNVPNKREQNQSCLDSAEREGLRPNGNVPNLRFPEFRGEWEKVRLGEECNMLCGYAFNGEDIVEQGSYLLMRGINITEGSIRHSSELDRYYSGSIEKLDKYKLAIGDLVIGMDGSKVGRNSAIVSSYEDGSYLVQRVCRIRSSIGNNYILQFINNTKFRQYVDTVKTSSAIPHISLRDIKNYRISIPSTQDETDKIAKLFLLLDERIATQNKIIDKLQSLIKGLNDTLYAQHSDEVMTSFAELGTSYSGLSGKSAQDFGSGKPFITYLNVYSNNIINKNDFQYVAIKDGEEQNIVEYGDVLFTLSSETPNEVGIGSVFLGKEKVYLNSFCFGIHITNKEVAFSPYLSYYVSSTAFRKFIYPYAQGSTRFNLCKADFEKASIKLPTLENQKRIYSILSHIDNKIITERQMLDLYNSQKQYLLRQMFI